MKQQDELREIQEIIVGDSVHKLDALKKRIESLDERVSDVAEVLPTAIRQKVELDDDLITALQEPVSKSIKKTIRKDPAFYAEVLYPVMAPSIRLAISQAIQSLMVTINKKIGSAASFKSSAFNSLKLRYQSLASGVSYAELVLQQSLLYTVKHVFLIDRDTGLLIVDVSHHELGDQLQSDAVSAMFTAIQSFVQDSFSNNENDKLTDLKVGEHYVWVVHGPKLMLACVIDGNPPESFKEKLYDALDGIRASYAVQIEQFHGDASAFVNIENYLTPLLQTKVKSEHEKRVKEKKEFKYLAWLKWVALFVVVFWLLKAMHLNTKLDTVHHFLKKTPGVVVSSVELDSGNIVAKGLIDPDAVIPFEALKYNGIDSSDIVLDMIPFRSLEISVRKERLLKELSFPQEIALTSKGNFLFLSGSAPLSWFLRHRFRLAMLSVNNEVDMSGLQASEASILEYVSQKMIGKSDNEIRNQIEKYKHTDWGRISGFSLP